MRRAGTVASITVGTAIHPSAMKTPLGRINFCGTRGDASADFERELISSVVRRGDRALATDEFQLALRRGEIVEDLLEVDHVRQGFAGDGGDDVPFVDPLLGVAAFFADSQDDQAVLGLDALGVGLSVRRGWRWGPALPPAAGACRG